MYNEANIQWLCCCFVKMMKDVRQKNWLSKWLDLRLVADLMQQNAKDICTDRKMAHRN